MDFEKRVEIQRSESEKRRLVRDAEDGILNTFLSSSLNLDL